MNDQNATRSSNITKRQTAAAARSEPNHIRSADRSPLLGPLALWTIVILVVATVLASRGTSALSPVSRNIRYLIQSIKTPAATVLHRPITTVSNPLAMPSKEDQQWNHLATRMDVFHNHFRSEFDRVYTLADGGFHKQGMTLQRFLREAQQLAHHLDMHHKIETYIFPVLAKKMPQFKAGARESGEHLKSHKAIHTGLDKYEAFLRDALAKPSSYSPETLREVMDSFRDILFRHLDEEVHDLGADSMKKAGWTLAEVKAIPM